MARRSALRVLALALVAACRSPSEPRARAAPPEVFVEEDAPIPLPPRLIAVPLVRQRTPFSCGDAAVLAVLRLYDPARYGMLPESSLFAPLHTTPELGTEPQPMAAYLSQEPGLSAEVRWSTPGGVVTVDDVELAVDRGEPAIVAVQAWQPVALAKNLKPWATDWDDGHYLVVIGYDAQNLYFMDPSTADHYTYIPRGEFADRWHDVLGLENAHTQHIAIFVHAALTPRPAAALASRQGSVTFVH